MINLITNKQTHHKRGINKEEIDDFKKYYKVPEIEIFIGFKNHHKITGKGMLLRTPLSYEEVDLIIETYEKKLFNEFK